MQMKNKLTQSVVSIRYCNRNIQLREILNTSNRHDDKTSEFDFHSLTCSVGTSSLMLTRQSSIANGILFLKANIRKGWILWTL